MQSNCSCTHYNYVPGLVSIFARGFSTLVVDWEVQVYVWWLCLVSVMVCLDLVIVMVIFPRGGARRGRPGNEASYTCAKGIESGLYLATMQSAIALLWS